MPGGSGAAALSVGGAVVLTLLTAMTLDVFSGFWDALLENKGPVIMVAVGLLIAWLSLRDDSGDASGTAGPRGRPGASGGGQLAGAAAQPYPAAPAGMAPGGSAGGRGEGGAATRRRPQEGSSGGSGAGNKELSLRREDSASGKLGSLADTPPRRRKVQGNVRSAAVEMVAVGSSGSMGGSRQGSGSMALVPADDMSGALARGCTLFCAKPAGCGYRHSCLDLGRRWMRCDKHGSHPLPPDGSVWREVVPEQDPAGGSLRLCLCQLRLCLAWDGTALDVTGVGACRGWDQELTAAVCTLLHNGRRVSGMCSQSPSFPVLRKWQEVATMDYNVAVRGRRLWSMFERWITARNGSGSRPLAIEIGSRAG